MATGFGHEGRLCQTAKLAQPCTIISWPIRLSATRHSRYQWRSPTTENFRMYNLLITTQSGAWKKTVYESSNGAVRPKVNIRGRSGGLPSFLSPGGCSNALEAAC